MPGATPPTDPERLPRSGVKVTTTIRVDSAILSAFDAYAEANDRSRSDACELSMEEAIIQERLLRRAQRAAKHKPK